MPKGQASPDPSSVFVVPLLPTPIQCPGEAATATIVLSAGGNAMTGAVECRFATADGRPCGEVIASLQGEIE